MKTLLAKLEACDAWRWPSEQDLRKDIHAATVELAQIVKETRLDLLRLTFVLDGRVQMDVRCATAEPQHIARIDDVLDGVIRRATFDDTRGTFKAELNEQREASANRITELEALLENERTAHAATREGAERRARGYIELRDNLEQRLQSAEAELKLRGEQLEAAGRAAAAATTRAEVAEAAVDGLGRESELLIKGRTEQRIEIERLRAQLANWHRELSVAVGFDPDTDHGRIAALEGLTGWEALIEWAAADHKQARALKTRPFEVLHGLGYRAPGPGSVAIVSRAKPDGIVELTADERDALEIPVPAPGRQWWRRGDEIYYGGDVRPDFFPEDNGSVLARATEIIHRQRGSLVTAAALESAIRKALPAR